MTRRDALLVMARSLAAMTSLKFGVPLAAAATPKIARIGIVSPGSPSNADRGYVIFSDRLRELGWIEGQNLTVERRWANGRTERLPALMAEVLGRNVDVIFTVSTPAAIAATNATNTTPIVAVAMGDPVRSGVVTNLARPGGNLTGMSMGFGEEFSGKWLELLQETVPRLTDVAMIINPDTPVARDLAKDAETIGPTRRLTVHIFKVTEAIDLDEAFKQARRKAQAALVHGDGLLTLPHREKVTALAARHRIPAVYNLLQFMSSGGLMAYAPDTGIMCRRAADYVDKILNGASPGDLPIEQPTRFSLAVNLKAAKTLGLSIPESILLRADEVIR